MGEYLKLCGKRNVDMVCVDDDTHVGHHNYVRRETIATLTRDLAEARAELEAAAATFDDEEAAHAETLRDLAEAREQIRHLTDAHKVECERADQRWDHLAEARADLAELRGRLKNCVEANTALVEKERAAYDQAAEARRQLEEAGSIIERLYNHVANERAGVPTGTVLDAAAWRAAGLPSKPPAE